METSPDIRKKILFIVNPVSGTRKNRNLENRIASGLDPARFDHRISFTGEPGHSTQLAKKAVEEKMDIVVAVGGDGTVNEIGQALVDTEVLLGILPAGSGNGLARHLGIPLSVTRALGIINRMKSIKMDTAVLNDKVFLSVAGIGYDAYVAKRFAALKHRGFLPYFRIVSGEYFRYKPRKYRIEIDGKILKRKAFLITFANSGQFGYNTVIDPAARIDDGYIDVCIVRKIPFAILPLYLPLLYTKSFNKTRFIEIIPAKNVVIRRKKGKTIHFDGDPSSMGKELILNVKPLSLNVIVP